MNNAISIVVMSVIILDPSLSVLTPKIHTFHWQNTVSCLFAFVAFFSRFYLWQGGESREGKEGGGKKIPASLDRPKNDFLPFIKH